MKRAALILFAGCMAAVPFTLLLLTDAADSDHAYLMGRGRADVTGPARGVQMWGFVREGQITEGIHFRLFARAFVIAERTEPSNRLAFVSIDIGSVTNAMQREVVDRLRDRFGVDYSLHNVILSATHTHSGPGGYWHYGADTPLGSPLLGEHFDAIVDGVVSAIAQAHDDLRPASIAIDSGTVEGAGANRSIAAYDANPAEERARYASDSDKNMTLLKFTRDDGAVGMVNWFASHPTAMTYYNRLISGDHKGHASARFEEEQGSGFVAAFAQSNAGDISPNLNLDNTGPGENEFETTRIIAERQFEVARSLFASASKTLSGPIRSTQVYVNLAYHPVDAAYTNGAGPQTTCPSAFGYAFAAGSTEDGGGHPMFKEGMKIRNTMVDNLVKEQFDVPEPSDRCRECHGEKAILFATGESEPPQQTQVVPMTLARIGQLTLVAVPAEFSTMAGRRLRESVASTMGGESATVVIAGYANDYCGYVTTREEYATQQYEGGHTLYGPWTLAAYQQEFDRLAQAMLSGKTPVAGPEPRDLRGTVSTAALEASAVSLPRSKKFGEVHDQPKRRYRTGDVVTVVFFAEAPRVRFPHTGSYVTIQRKQEDTWESVATDNDWATRVRWTAAEDSPKMLTLEVSWHTSNNTAEGEYRIVHQGFVRAAGGSVEPYEGASRTFRIR